MRRIFLSILIALMVLPAALLARPPKKPKTKQPDPDDTPTSRPAAMVIKLPGVTDAVLAGGGGKYLVLHLRDLQQLGIFDVPQAKIVKLIPLPGSNPVYAVSAEKIFVAYKDLGQIQRYALPQGTLEATANVPAGGVNALAAATNATSPVIALGSSKKRFWQIDPVTLKFSDHQSKNWGTESSAWGPEHVYVSFDGSAVLASGGGWSGAELTTVSGSTVTDLRTAGHVRGDDYISGDGSLTFPKDQPMVRSDLETPIDVMSGAAFFPADDASYSLSFEHKRGNLTVFPNNNPHPLITLGRLPELKAESKMPLPQRIHLIPSQSALVTVGDGADTLLIRKFDLLEQLAAMGSDYLLVSSTPVTTASRGKPYAYEMKVLSKKGSVKLELQSGPPGMTVDAAGKIQWMVPPTFSDATAPVIVQIADASGQTIFHTFVVHLPGSSAGSSGTAVAAATPRTSVAANQSESHRAKAIARPAPVATPAPAPAADETKGEITQLAEAFDEYHAAAGGRKLVFHLPQARRLDVYDTATGKLDKSIPLPGDHVLFACNKDSVVVAFIDLKIFQHYDLQTGQRTKSAPLPDSHPLRQMLMGNASAGPVILWFGDKVMGADPQSLALIRYRGDLPSCKDDTRWFPMRISADGGTLVTCSTYGSPSNFIVTHLRNNSATALISPEGESMGGRNYAPSADGALIFWGFHIFNGAARALEQTLGTDYSFAPTSDRRYFLGVKNPVSGHSAVAICITTNHAAVREVLGLLDLGETKAGDHSTRAGQIFEMAGVGEPRVVFLPDQKLLVGIPITNDRFQRMPVDLNDLAALPPSGSAAPAETGTLDVVSLPPAEVIVNTEFRYQIEVLPEKRRVTYKIESAPPGLTVSPTGLVLWKPTERPVGGKVNVILTVTDASGHEAAHAFEIAVNRPPTAPSNTVAPAGAIVKADGSHLELPGNAYQYTPGMGGKMLLLSDNQLSLLAPDGFTIQKTQTLPKSYTLIGERSAYYVAVSKASRSIDLIDKSTLKVLRSRSIAFESIDALALNPTLPISYISYTQPGAILQHFFMIFNETTTEALTDDNWLGTWLAVSPNGDFLMAGFKEFFRKGNDIIDNPDRIWIVPSYGTLDLLCRFDLDPGSGIPLRVASREHVGANGSGIRLSPDGKRATYLSFTGYPDTSHNLGGWNARDLSKLPVNYPCNGVAGTSDLAFHPLLPIVACCKGDAVVFFNRETGEKQENRIAGDPLAGEEILRVYFSPDGKSLIAETKVQDVHYLHPVKLVLSPEETRAVGALPRPDKPMGSTPQPAAPGRQKLPTAEA